MEEAVRIFALDLATQFATAARLVNVVAVFMRCDAYGIAASCTLLDHLTFFGFGSD